MAIPAYDPNQFLQSGAQVNGQNQIVAPPTGETPLAALPKYGGTGGDIETGKYYAGKKFFELFHRNPTASELTMLAPAYAAGDVHLATQGPGDAAVAQYYQSLVNTPERQQATKQKQNEADAPKYYDQINQMFKGTLGRDATDDEKKHFGSLMATGTTDAYTVGQYLQALPENVKKQDEEFRNNLSGTLQKQDAQYFGEQIMPSIQSNFAKQGRSVDSSAFANSLALAGQGQNRQRESFLSGLTADQYQNSQNLAQQAYQNAYSNNQNLSNYNMQRTNQLQDSLTGRVNELQNYGMQKQAYDDYLRRYGKRNNGVGGLVGTAVGAGLGGWLGGSTGATIGGQVGGGFGNAFQG